MKRILLIVLALAVTAGVGYVAASKVWGFPMFGGGQPKPKPEPEVQLVVISLGQFMTNLADSGRFIRVSVDLEVDMARSEGITNKASGSRRISTRFFARRPTQTYPARTG